MTSDVSTVDFEQVNADWDALGRVNIMEIILFPFEKHLFKLQTVTQQTIHA